jgi:hypothetical protein
MGVAAACTASPARSTAPSRSSRNQAACAARSEWTITPLATRAATVNRMVMAALSMAVSPDSHCSFFVPYMFRCVKRRYRRAPRDFPARRHSGLDFARYPR